MGSTARTNTGAQARTAAKTGTNAKAGNARQKLAARRAADRIAEARKRLLLPGGSVAVVLALVATLIAVKLTQSRRTAPRKGTEADHDRIPAPRGHSPSSPSAPYQTGLGLSRSG